MSDEILIMAMFLSMMFGLIFLGVHLGFLLGTIAVIAGFIGWEGTTFFPLFPLSIWRLMQNWVLVAIPSFVFMGYMLERSGIGEDLFGGVEILAGNFRGGMAITVIILTTLIAACTGIVATGVIMAGVFALPSMLRRGYHKGLALGVVAAGGTLGILIPPSVMLVFYAGLTGLSVGKLFLAAFPSGLVLSGLYLLYTVIITNLFPRMAPRRGEVPEVELPGLPTTDMFDTIAKSRRPRLRATRGFLPVLFLIAAVMGSIIFGIATPTEASAFGAAGAIIVAATYRRFNMNILKEACSGTLRVLGMSGGVVIGATCFAAIFIGLGGKEIVYNLFIGLDAPPILVMWLMVATVVFMGCFLDDLAILLILLPVFIPIQQAMEWHDIWFALIFCVSMQTAWLSPPFGYALVYLRGLNMPGVTFADVVKGCAPFVGLQIIGVGILIAFPRIVTYLPDLLIK